MIIKRQKEFGVLQEGIRNLATGAGVAAAGTGAATVGLGQLASSGVAAGSLLLRRLAYAGAAHPLLAGGLAAYGLYKLLKRRHERKMAEKSYSVIGRIKRRIIIVPKKGLNRDLLGKYLKKMFESETVPVVTKAFSETQVIAGREIVPKKIAKKAEKKGVVQQDSEGNWRVINMHGPNGQAVYWKPKYKSKESASKALQSYSMGKWNKKN